MDENKSLELIAEAVRYCQRVASMGMPVSCYTKSLREPIYFLWRRRAGKNKASTARFRSKKAVGLSFGNWGLVLDDAVPFRYLQTKLLKLPKANARSVRSVLERFDTLVLITKEEDNRLNAAGYQSKMPDDWDKKDPLARYKAVGIELVENTIDLRKPAAKP